MCTAIGGAGCIPIEDISQLRSTLARIKNANANKTVSVATGAETTPGAVVHTSTSTFTQSGIEVAMHAEASYPDVLVADALYSGRSICSSVRGDRDVLLGSQEPFVGS